MKELSSPCLMYPYKLSKPIVPAGRCQDDRVLYGTVDLFAIGNYRRQRIRQERVTMPNRVGSETVGLIRH